MNLLQSIVLELQQLIWAEQSETAIGNISDLQLEQIAAQPHAFIAKPSGNGGAIVLPRSLLGGGIPAKYLKNKAAKQKGLYFIAKCSM